MIKIIRKTSVVTVPVSAIDTAYEQGYRDGKEAVLSVLRGQFQKLM